jgi:AraC-like DNA-binding protein
MAIAEIALSLEPGQTHRLGSVASVIAGGVDHHHDGCELLWVRRGSLRLRIATRELTLRAGSLLLLGPGLTHRLAGPARADGIAVHFAVDPSPLSGADAWRLFLPFARAARRGLLLERIADPALRRALARLPKSGGLRALSRFVELTHLLCHQRWKRLLVSSAIGDPLARAPAWLHSLCARVDARLAEPLDLAELGRLGGIGRSALAAAFRHYYGCGPMTWVARRRILRACEMLLASDRRVIDVALACGFASLSAFNRRFVALTGVPPARWRTRRAGPGAERRRSAPQRG